jgi:DNA mismatch repair protein MutS2
LKNIVDIIERLDNKSLILLDEIGAGTDPEEGAALAKAVLDNMIERGALTVATTHYGELKEFAFAREGVENASVEFDVQTLRPTYRLMVGVPGSSNAFAIASRLGLPQEIVRKAGEMMRGGEASDAMIRKIEESYRSASEREQVAERASRDADILRSRYEERLNEIDTLRKEMRRQLTEEIDRRVREKVTELDRIIESIKSQGSQPNLINEERNRFKRRVKEIHQEIEEILPQAKEYPDEPHTYRKGDRVKVISFDMEGDLLGDPEGDVAYVLVGSMKVNVPISDLRPVRKPVAKPAAASKEPSSEASQIASAKTSTVSAELKLIAQRSDRQNKSCVGL